VNVHPAKLVVLFPMFVPRDYRRHLTAIDDGFVVHVGADGTFRFQLRPLRRLGPRSYGSAIIGLADDLESGHVVVIVGREGFVNALEPLAREHARPAEAKAVERAMAIVAEHTGRRLLDHLECGADPEHRLGRALVAQRARRTRARKGDRDDGVSCMHGIPVPRAEQLWHSLRSELCNVRTAQHAYAAWKQWVGRNRPDLPRADRSGSERVTSA
jgi:hypothetical protein